jgi:Holliday junction resolvasome RuvABC DNA-binding subunit
MTENIYTTDNADYEALLALGFTEAEAVRILYMKVHVEEQAEYRELLAERHRLDFVRWLIEHDRLFK